MTIISNDCCAGCIYSDIGFKFLSPTINLYINGEDFLKFVRNLEKYLEIEIIEEKENDYGYPIGILPDKKDGNVRIEFVHYKNFEEAKEKWNERKKRVDFNNLLILFHVNDNNQAFVNEIKKINYNKKIIAYENQCIEKNDDVIILKSLKEFIPSKILKTNKFTGKRFLEEINYISLFNRR